MNLFLISLLGVLGVTFGSFASVIIYRLRSGEKGIWTGRSHCGSCHRILEALDLIPLVSWLIHRGKCRTCKAQVSALYPLLEIATALLFIGVGMFLIDVNLLFSGNIGEGIKLIFWLLISFFSIIYIFYDILFLEIHEGVMFWAIGIALFGVILQSIFAEIGGVSLLQNLPTFSKNLSDSGVFLSLGYLGLVVAGLYTIILAEFSEIWDILILISLGVLLFLFGNFFPDMTQYTAISASIGALSIFLFFFVQILISGGKWMGGGDLRIAIFVGLLLGSTLSFPAMMLCYFAGSIIGIGMLVFQKYIQHKKTGAMNQVPFGPFIAAGFFLAIFFQNQILDCMQRWLFI